MRIPREGNTDPVQQELFGGCKSSSVRNLRERYAAMSRGAVFKGTSVRRDGERGEEVDWKIPFSDLFADACLASPTLRGKLQRGELTVADIEAQGDFTSFGSALRSVVEGCTLVDLGCGGPQSRVPKELARLLGVPYVGIDRYDGFEERIEDGPTPRAYIRGEILDALATIGRGGTGAQHLVLLLSGIELANERPLFPGDSTALRNEQYAQACQAEMNRSKPRAIIIGAGTSLSLRPDPARFTRTAATDVWSDLGTGGSRPIEIWVPNEEAAQRR